MFSDRKEAGHALADSLHQYKKQQKTIVLGLARGGVIVASALADDLKLPLNAIVCRKIGAPNNLELALGAITENETGVFNQQIIEMLNVSEAYLSQEMTKEKAIAEKRTALYREYCPIPNLENYNVILVDDGIATGATMLVAILAMRKKKVAKVIVAVPVAATSSLQLVRNKADEVVCLFDSEDFFSVGYYYQDFQQTEDEEIVETLKQAKSNHDRA